MTEAYAFFAMFTVQILAMSVLQPILFVRYCRIQAMSIPPERLAQLYPGVDLNLAEEHFLARVRGLNTAVAGLGLLLLGWFFTYTRQPGWDESPMVMLAAVYFVVQMLPMAFIGWSGFRFNKLHMRPWTQSKRKALLERRGLLDFVSPVVVHIGIFGYVAFAAFVVYIQEYTPAAVGPVKPWLGYALLGAVTTVYVLEGLFMYAIIHGKKNNPFATHADRVHTIDRAVKSCVYGCIACLVFIAAVFILVLLDLNRWQPFALSTMLATSTLLSLMTLTPRPREPDAMPPSASLPLGRPH